MAPQAVMDFVLYILNFGFLIATANSVDREVNPDDEFLDHAEFERRIAKAPSKRQLDFSCFMGAILFASSLAVAWMRFAWHELVLAFALGFALSYLLRWLLHPLHLSRLGWLPSLAINIILWIPQR